MRCASVLRDSLVAHLVHTAKSIRERQWWHSRRTWSNSILLCRCEDYEDKDTVLCEDYVHMRCLSYPNTDVFLLCFSLVDPKSLDVCQTVWLPEIRKYAGDNVPVLLIGTKEDLLESPAEKQRVTFDVARKTAREMGCVKFLPCSALTHRGLKQVFDEALLLAIGAPVKDDYRAKPCCSVS